MVHCKTQTVPSGQRRCLQEGGQFFYKQAKYTLEKKIRVAKRNYSDKLRIQFSSSDSASMWKGMKDITSYKTQYPSTVENQQHADNLNEFSCRFEKHPTPALNTWKTAGATQPLTPPATTLSPTPAIQISEDKVCQVFRKQKIHMRLHYVLQHPDRPGAYVRILFVDFSSAFNTIIPTRLLPKLTQLSVPTSICQWIISFLTDRQQLVRLGKYTSSTRTISTGAPQGCVLFPLLFSLYTKDCTSKKNLC